MFLNEACDTHACNSHVHSELTSTCTSTVKHQVRLNFFPLGNMNDEDQLSINSDYSQDCSPLYPLRYNDRGLPAYYNKRGHLA